MTTKLATSGSNNNNNNVQEDESSACSTALLLSLHFSGVRFLRYFTVDAFNNVRCKAKPVENLLSQKHGLEDGVSIAEICYAGLPRYADMAVSQTGLTAAKSLVVRPDLSTLRILPYAPSSAMVLGWSVDPFANNDDSPYCTRSLLRRVVRAAKRDHNVAFSVGVEIEFCLVDTKTNDFVDQSLFANTNTLNEQEAFLNDLHDQLRKQYIPVELIHAESGPGQVEVVLQYSDDPVVLADNLVLTNETIKAVARNHGCKALLLPKYDAEKAGNGMHVHLSLRDATTGTPIFSGEEKSTLSATGSSFVEGLLQHLPGVLGLTMPTANSYRRVGPGCWTGSTVGWALEDKEVGIRICSNPRTQKWDHVECKLVDASCNLYLGLAVLLTSGLDGISQQLALRPPITESVGGDPLPKNLKDALECLRRDDVLMTTMGPRLSQAYLAVRAHEAKRSSAMTLDDELKEALARC